MQTNVRTCEETCWFGVVAENAVQARLAVPTVMMNVTLTDALKKQGEEMRNGSGWKWND